MAKKIKIPSGDKKYVLEYTRKTASVMERSGFNLDELTDKPNTMIPMLFRGAFLANHKDTKESTIEKIYDGLTRKTALINELIDMYRATSETLLDDTPLEDEGNPDWETEE